KVNSVSGILGEEVIAPILLNFLQQNPKVNIHLDFSSHKVNLLDSDYDLVIRMGNLVDSNLIVSPLSTVATNYVASHDFIQKHGQVTNP
ncbi:LysR substrate-binding domain-containing protein, partial [Francisella tularensis]|uniref:LysR substrate-binding domain-containing protein n=1 Tax=Francisella tularensis TaxID=263 RepID=UPI002381AC96